MKWTAICSATQANAGSWRHTNFDIENQVREEVRSLLAVSNGMVSGSALGVDFFATDEALQKGVDASQLKIIIKAARLKKEYAAFFLYITSS
jgi:hypothetical protein